MQAVECRSVISILYLKGRTHKETFYEVKEVYGDVNSHVTWSGTCIASSHVIRNR